MSSGLIVHNVYFTLKNNTPENQRRLIDSAQQNLQGIPGIVVFAVGTLVPDLTRPVNDLEFNVGLHIVFQSRAAHDEYQPHPRHLAFIEENKESWAKVRVFDSQT